MCIRDRNGQTLHIQAASGQTHTYDGTLGAGTLDVSGAGTQVLRSSGADTDLTAVSYTHLDVYKRQISYSGINDVKMD